MSSDGSIIIDLKLDNKNSLEELKKANKDINKSTKEIEANLKSSEREIDKQTEKVEKLSKKYKETAKEAEKQRKALNEKYSFLKGSSVEGDIGQMRRSDKDYSNLKKLNSARNEALAQLVEEKKILAQQKEAHAVLTNKYEAKKLKQQEINQLLQEEQERVKNTTQDVEKNTKKIKTHSAGFGKGLLSSFKSLLKISLMLVGIRSIFYAITGSVNTWLSGSSEKAKQLSADIKFLKYTIAEMLAPAIEYVVSLFYKLLGLVNAVLKSFTGVDYLAKALAKYTKDSKKNMQGTLASFDQLEVYGDKEKTPSDLTSQTQDFEGFADKIKLFWQDLTMGMDFAPLLDSFGKLKEAIGNLGDVSWDILKDGYEHFLKPVGTLVINKLLPDTLNFLADVINWLADTLKVIEPYWIWFLDNVLTPLATWVINEFVPTFFELLKTALDALTPVIEIFCEVFKDMWDIFFEPIAKFTGGIIISFLKLLTDLLKKFGDWAGENTYAIATFIELFLGFLSGIWVYNSSKMIVPFLTNFATAIAGLWGALKKGEFLKTLSILLTNFTEKLNLAKIATNLVSGAFGALVVAIGLIIANWDKMNGLERVVSIFGAVTLAVTALVVAVVGLQNAWSLGAAAVAIAIGVTAVMATISSAKKRAEAEAEASIAKANSIPKLAKGGIVNRPTQALIGEAGREAVIPLENNTEWIDELADKIGRKSDVKITFNGSLAQLGRVLNPVITQDNKRIGTRRITGGVNA